MSRRISRTPRATIIRFRAQVDMLDERNLVSTLIGGFASQARLSAGPVEVGGPAAQAPAGRPSAINLASTAGYGGSMSFPIRTASGPATPVVYRALPTPTIALTVGKSADSGHDWLDLRDEEPATSNGVGIFMAPAASSQGTGSMATPEEWGVGGTALNGSASSPGLQQPVGSAQSTGTGTTTGSGAIAPLYLPAPTSPATGAHTNAMSPMIGSGGGSGGGGSDGGISWSGGGQGIVGGAVNVWVAAAYNEETITSVTWSIPEAVKSQTYNNSGGTNTLFSGTQTDTWAGGAVGFDSWSGYWNAQTDYRTISVTVETNLGTFSHTWDPIYVTAPDGSLSVTQAATQQSDVYDTSTTPPTLTYPGGAIVGGNANNQTAIVMTGSTPQYAGSGGEFAVIQKINATVTIVSKNAAGQNVTHQLQTGNVVDNDPAAQSSEYSFFLEGGVLFCDNGQTVTHEFNDIPSTPYMAGAGETPVSVTMQYDFQDYLVFAGGGGIWVSLGHTDYSMSGTLNWQNGPNAAPTAANLTPNAPQTPAFQDELSLVDWSNFFTGVSNKGNFNPAIS